MTSWMGATALAVIGAQLGFDDETFFGPRSNPSAEDNIAQLLAGWDIKEIVLPRPVGITILPALVISASSDQFFYISPQRIRQVLNCFNVFVNHFVVNEESRSNS